MQSLQEYYAPKSICYGCGPANNKGLQIRSFLENGRLIAHWIPKPYHAAFENVLSGGIIGTLLDCHCNWAAAYALMKFKNSSAIPCTVTAEYTIKLLRPIPMDTELFLEAFATEIKNNRAAIKGKITINDKVYATCQGLFVAVDHTHPGFHRW